MQYKSIFSILILSIGMLGGCGAARPSKYYQLTVPGNITPAINIAPYGVTLLVGPVTAPRVLRDDRIVYTSTDEEMGTYEYHRWIEPPPEMIEDVLLQELQESGRYQYVHDERSNVHGRYLLRGRLYNFTEVDAKLLVARVAFRFELFDSQAGTIVWNRSYSHDERVEGKNVSAVVAAMDRNVQNGLHEVMQGLDQYFSTATSR